MNKEEADPSKKELLDTFIKSSNDLVTIVSDVLHLSKLESGKEHVHLSSFNLYTIIKDSIDLYKDKALLNQVEIINGLEEELFIKSNRLKLTQVLNNYISNAVKFTKTGEIKVSADISGSELKLMVTDTGRGIKEEELEKVFAKYIQTSETLEKKEAGEEEGTGLGLQICTLIADLLGGKVGVEREYGKGSSFWIKIQIEKVEGIESKKTISKAFQGKINAKVLLVHDKAINLKVASLMLHKLGCTIETAENGEEAVIKAIDSAKSFDIILIDIHMPVMNGIVASAEIKRVLGDKAPPIIALTAKNMEGDREEILLKGLDGFLPKPIRKDEIEAMLLKHTT